MTGALPLSHILFVFNFRGLISWSTDNNGENIWDSAIS